MNKKLSFMAIVTASSVLAASALAEDDIDGLEANPEPEEKVVVNLKVNNTPLEDDLSESLPWLREVEEVSDTSEVDAETSETTPDVHVSVDAESTVLGGANVQEVSEGEEKLAEQINDSTALEKKLTESIDGTSVEQKNSFDGVELVSKEDLAEKPDMTLIYDVDGLNLLTTSNLKKLSDVTSTENRDLEVVIRLYANAASSKKDEARKVAVKHLYKLRQHLVDAGKKGKNISLFVEINENVKSDRVEISL